MNCSSQVTRTISYLSSLALSTFPLRLLPMGKCTDVPRSAGSTHHICSSRLPLSLSPSATPETSWGGLGRPGPAPGYLGRSKLDRIIRLYRPRPGYSDYSGHGPGYSSQVPGYSGRCSGCSGNIATNRKILILSDSQAAMSAVRKAGRTGKARATELKRVVEEIRIRQARLGPDAVRLGWVKAHVGTGDWRQRAHGPAGERGRGLVGGVARTGSWEESDRGGAEAELAEERRVKGVGMGRVVKWNRNIVWLAQPSSVAFI